MTLQDLDRALKAQVPETYENAAPQGVKRYVVWAKYGEQPIAADDHIITGFPKVQIDIVTNIQHDTIVSDVQFALWLLDLPYSFESEGYDPDYNAMRTILQVVVS